MSALVAFALMWPFTVPMAIAAFYIGYRVRTAAAVWCIVALSIAFSLAVNLLGDAVVQLFDYGREGFGYIMMGLPSLALFMYLFFGIGQLYGRWRSKLK